MSEHAPVLYGWALSMLEEPRDRATEQLVECLPTVIAQLQHMLAKAINEEERNVCTD